MTVPRALAALAMIGLLLGGCSSFQVVDKALSKTLAKHLPTDPPKELTEAQNQIKELQKKTEELLKAAEEAKKAAAEDLKAAKEAAKEELKAKEEEAKAKEAAAKEESKAKEEAAAAQIKALEHDKRMAEVEAKLKEVEQERKLDEKVAEVKAAYEEKAAQPSTFTMRLFATQEANPNLEGEPSPVSVRILALSAPHRLQAGDFFAMSEDPAAALGPTMLGDLGELKADPGLYAISGALPMPAGTRFIGVLAGFSDIDKAVWRAYAPVADTGETGEMLIVVDEAAVRIMRGEP